MFSTSDTVVAIATPPGRGGLGLVRLSGPRAHFIAQQLTSRTKPFAPRYATLTTVSSAQSPIDNVIVTFFRGPRSFTGEDTVEFSAHGSMVVLRAIVAATLAVGARLAEPGEFTLRAFLNGRVDLMQAEALGDLVDAVTPLQARVAFDQLHGTLTEAITDIANVLFDLIARLEASVDFPDEGYHFLERKDLSAALDDVLGRTSRLLADAARGRLVREGFQVAIVGRPNVGKSSLFNALTGAARSIVTSVPGTTRDLLTERVEVDGYRVTLVDTAGLRATNDEIESQGVQRAQQAVATSDLLLVVLDASDSDHEAERDIIGYTSEYKRLIVLNKCDLSRARADQYLPVSAATGEGLDNLRRQLAIALDVEPRLEPPSITNLRHIGLVSRAQQSLQRAREACEYGDTGLSEEFVLADLQVAREALEEISGKRASEDLLEHIFSRFCVGK